MPFKSKAQARKCFAMKRRRQNGSWDCEEWADETNFSGLPDKVAHTFYKMARQHAILNLAQFLDDTLDRVEGGPLLKHAAVNKSVTLLRELEKGASLNQALGKVCPDLPPMWRSLLGRIILKGASLYG